MHDEMPDQHREFYASLEYILVGTDGADGKPYASILTGPAGFASSLDPKTLRIKNTIDGEDPAFAALKVGAPGSVLGIELSTRRSNRMHGRIARANPDGFEITVSQSWAQLLDSFGVDNDSVKSAVHLR